MKSNEASVLEIEFEATQLDELREFPQNDVRNRQRVIRNQVMLSLI
jgi:hypothetical protein